MHLAYVLSAGKDNNDDHLLAWDACQRVRINLERLKAIITEKLKKLPKEDPSPNAAVPSPNLIKVLREAQSTQEDTDAVPKTQANLLLALIKDKSIKNILNELHITEDLIESGVAQAQGICLITTKKVKVDFKALGKYALDHTALAKEGKIDPVIGRNDKIRSVIEIQLCQRTKSNPVLLGEPGIGKTAIVEGLAQRIAKRDVPDLLLEYVFGLNLGTLKAGASAAGKYEERIKLILTEMEKKSKEGVGIVPFIDEFHLIMAGSVRKSGGAMDTANLFKPALARGKLRCIGAMTYSEYRQYIEKDTAFERRFAKVDVKEPSIHDTISILHGIRGCYEVHHGLRNLKSAITQAATLAHCYFPSCHLPDSVIDLLDQACAHVCVKHEIRPEDIDKMVQRMVELTIKIRALKNNTDSSSDKRLAKAKMNLKELEEQLEPCHTAYQRQMEHDNKIHEIQKTIDKLTLTADRAEICRDMVTVSRLRGQDIPNQQKELKELECERALDESSVTDEVTLHAIAKIVTHLTSIPVTKLVSSKREKLLNMENILTQSVVRQPEAVKAVADAIQLLQTGLVILCRPIALFLMAGPSGTGKTQLSKALAALLFDSSKAMIRIDGSKYSEKHSIVMTSVTVSLCGLLK
ncbi:hypothetical protein FRC12_022142 [Ceratobasidium sp. 428]|nr:hypothetical protein FRC12_022142 [Ceratobasidium sp. 428]